MYNPMCNPDFVKVGYVDTIGYTLYVQNIAANTILYFGQNPTAIVLFLQANNVRFFDYEDGLANNVSAFERIKVILDHYDMG